MRKTLMTLGTTAGMLAGLAMVAPAAEAGCVVTPPIINIVNPMTGGYPQNKILYNPTNMTLGGAAAPDPSPTASAAAVDPGATPQGGQVTLNLTPGNVGITIAPYVPSQTSSTARIRGRRR